MKKVISLLCAIMVLTFSVNAQSTLLKIYKAERTIDNAGKAIDAAGKVKGWFPKKDKKDKKSSKDSSEAVETVQPVSPRSNGTATTINTPLSPAGVNTTRVSIKGIDFSKLKILEENIKACAGVQTTVKKFNSSSSTIEIIHSGTTDALFALMVQTSKEIFTEANVETMEEGKIILKL